MTTLTNVHPADELAAIREEIKQLQGVEADLREKLMNASDEERKGDQYTAFVSASTRTSIDMKAIVAALGMDVVEPFIKATNIKSLKLARKDNAES